MSLINQVLNKLEQRGAHSAIDQAMVRSVPQRREPARSRLVVAAVLAVAALGILAWQWPLQGSSGGNAKLAERNMPETISGPIPMPASAVAIIASSGVGGPQTETQPGVETNGSRLVPGISAKPVIVSISPDPVPGRAAAQQLVIKGSGFNAGTTVTLHKSGGRIFANRAIVSQSDTEITINAKVGTSPGSWTAEVIDANRVSSGEYPFAVQAAPKQPAGQHMKTADMPAVSPAGNSEAHPIKRVSPAQQADAEYHKALSLMEQGQQAAALKGFEAALRLDAGHDKARQAMVAVLLAEKRGGDAERLLQEGLQSKPDHTGLAMLLARVQVERGGTDQAITTLEQFLPRAEAQADFQAFYAALLQRQKRHQEAIVHYQLALQHAPNNGVWLMGFAISLQAEHRNDDARQMFQRALDTATLSAELQAFVRQKLKEL